MISFPRLEMKAKPAFSDQGVHPMCNLFVLSWVIASHRTVLTIVTMAMLVFSIIALVKISSGANQEPTQKLLTGSIERSPSEDQAVSFVAPAAFQPALPSVALQGPVPLPRPRPIRI
jgi:hypothetical protein